MRVEDADMIYRGSGELARVYRGTTIVWEPVHDYARDYLTLTGSYVYTVGLRYADNLTNREIYWNVVGNGWQSGWQTATLTSANTSVTIYTATDDYEVRFKGSGSTFAGACVISGGTTVYGNVMSLLYGDDFKGKTTLPGQYTNFYSLFKGSSIVDAGNLCLPITDLSEENVVTGVYESMFENCTALVVPPELPATSLGRLSYANMFKGCSSLVTPPDLPATTLGTRCYYGIFEDCDSLLTAPALPATALTTGCYQRMFYDCDGLTKAPYLPALHLADSSYFYMFFNCDSLTEIRADFLDITYSNSTSCWVCGEGFPATGTFYKNANATWDVVGTNGVPTGWTIVYV